MNEVDFERLGKEDKRFNICAIRAFSYYSAQLFYLQCYIERFKQLSYKKIRVLSQQSVEWNKFSILVVYTWRIMSRQVIIMSRTSL